MHDVAVRAAEQPGRVEADEIGHACSMKREHRPAAQRAARPISATTPDNEVKKGAEALLHALHTHDDDWQGHARRQRGILGRYTSANLALVAEYDALLANLIGATAA